MEIDRATSTDAEAITATFGAARRTAMPWLPSLHTEAEHRRYFEGVLRECEVLVVRRDGLPVAFLALKDDTVEHLYVRPEAQRAGIGSALLQAAKSSSSPGSRRRCTANLFLT